MAKKKIINKFEIVLMAIAFCIISYVVMLKYDMPLAKRTEEVVFTDNPRSSRIYKKKEKSETRKQREREVEDMLKQLDGRTSKQERTPNRLADISRKKSKRSKDEDRFFKGMTSKYVDELGEREDVDVYALLKTSKDTYRKVRSLFSEELETPKSDAEILIEDVSSLLQNETVANSVYHELEELFGIPSRKSEDFAKKGQKAVSDWATFVEENKKE